MGNPNVRKSISLPLALAQDQVGLAGKLQLCCAFILSMAYAQNLDHPILCIVQQGIHSDQLFPTTPSP